MYIFELIYKIINKIKYPKPLNAKEDYSELYQECEQFFVPVDSTKKVLACTKCGLLKKID